MKKFYNWLLVGLAALLCLPACDEVMELSDRSAITSFSVKGHSPSTIELGDAYMLDDSLIVQLKYGRYDFPLLLRTTIQSSAGDRILNLVPDSIVFDSPDQVISFYIQTKSGLPLKRFLKIKELPRSNKAGVVQFKPKEYTSSFTTLIADSAVITDDSDGKRIILFMPVGGYPIQITPHIQLTDTATLEDYDPSVPMNFRRENDVIPLKVRSASGSVATWNVHLRRGYEPSANDYVSQPVYNTINLKSEELTSVGDAHTQVTEQSIDHTSKTITLTMKNIRPEGLGSEVKFPLTCSLTFPQSEPRMTVGYKSGSPITFADDQATASFYLIHTHEMYKEHWTVKLKRWKDTDNSVTSFFVTKSSPASILLGETVAINNERGTIVVPIEEGRQNFPLTFTASVAVPSTATLSGIAAKQTFVFADLTKKASFKVVAEDGTAKEYTVSVRFAGDKNAEANIDGFRITEVNSTDNRVKINNIPIINNENRTVEIEVLDWVRYFPLRVKAVVTASDGAEWLTPSPVATQWIEFEDIHSSYNYDIRSEDGTTTNTWVVKLKNSQPLKSDDASLKEFTLSGLSGGATLDKIAIDNDKRIVKVLLSQMDGELSFIPFMKPSDKATLIGINEGVRLTFTDLQPQSFLIRSESEEVSISWSIVPVLAPQLANNTFESWSGGNPVSWATANNSFVKGTTSTSGPTGLASLMTSKEADVLSIKEMAAGSLFLGRFNFSISLKDNPKKMTYFGIPFTARPESVTVDMNYVSSEMKGKNGMLGTPDKGSVAIMLLRWRGTGDIVFHDDDENADKIDKIGVVTANIEPTNGWIRPTYTIEYNPEFAGVQPTHIHIVFSSSYRGDFFETGTDSRLMVDNIKLNY